MKHLFVILVLFSAGLMSSTKPSMKGKLIGVWKIQSMEVKGLTMLHQQMGMPFMEFNEEGGFMVKLSNSKEKGRYAIKGSTVTLNYKIPPKPTQKIEVTKLNDTELDYTTITNSDTMHVICYRITQGFGDDDKDKDKDRDKDKKKDKD